jgi:transposase
LPIELISAIPPAAAVPLRKAVGNVQNNGAIGCAWAGARKKGSYLQAQFHRLRSRRGIKKAIGAVAASILTAAYHMLEDGTLYQDLGPDHFDRRANATQTRRLVTRLHNLGYAVQITPLAA